MEAVRKRPLDFDGYENVEILAAGGMGDVYRAQSIDSGQTVAIKVIKTSLDKEELPEIRKRFTREVDLAISLKHSNVVQTLERGTLKSGEPYVVMEYLLGNTLKEVVSTSGPIHIHDAVDCLNDIGEALSYCHKKGVVHRDIKPDNIFRRNDGTYILIDFGLAFDDEHTRLTKTGQVMGTFSYMSPEQLQGKSALPASDIYSLGVSIFTALTHTLPFSQDELIRMCSGQNIPPPIVNSRLPQESEPLSIVIQKCIFPDIKYRYSNSDELLRDLRLLEGGNLEYSARMNEKHVEPTILPAPAPGTGSAGAHALVPSVAQSNHSFRRFFFAGITMFILVYVCLVYRGNHDSGICGPSKPRGRGAAQDSRECRETARLIEQEISAIKRDMISPLTDSQSIPHTELNMLGSLVQKSRYVQQLHLSDSARPYEAALMYLGRSFEESSLPHRKRLALTSYFILFREVEDCSFYTGNMSHLVLSVFMMATELNLYLELYRAFGRFWPSSQDWLLRSAGAFSFMHKLHRQKDEDSSRVLSAEENLSVKRVLLEYGKVEYTRSFDETSIALAVYMKAVAVSEDSTEYEKYLSLINGYLKDGSYTNIQNWPELYFMAGLFCSRMAAQSFEKGLEKDRARHLLRSARYFKDGIALCEERKNVAMKLQNLRKYSDSMTALHLYRQLYLTLDSLSYEGFDTQSICVAELYKAQAALYDNKLDVSQSILEKNLYLSREWPQLNQRYLNYLSSVRSVKAKR